MFVASQRARQQSGLGPTLGCGALHFVNTTTGKVAGRVTD